MKVTLANPIYEEAFRALVEDEYFSNITEAKNEAAKKDAVIAEAKKEIAEQTKQIRQKDERLIEAAKALKAAGLPIENIVAITGVPFGVVSNL